MRLEFMTVIAGIPLTAWTCSPGAPTGGLRIQGDGSPAQSHQPDPQDDG
jgi:hypothetical protein